MSDDPSNIEDKIDENLDALNDKTHEKVDEVFEVTNKATKSTVKEAKKIAGKVKAHLKKYQTYYIVGASVTAGVVIGVVVTKKFSMPSFGPKQILEFSEKVLSAHPELKAEDLRYTIIDSKTYLGMVPAAVADTMKAGDTLGEHVGPLIFGSAVAFMHDGTLLAVFPL